MSRNRLFLYVLILAIALTFLANAGIPNHAPYRFDVDIKAMGNFNFDQVKGTDADIPAHFRKLDGQKVRLQGFMWPPTSASRLNAFQFVYNIIGPWGRPLLVQERVFAHLPAGQTVPYHDEYVWIAGTLHVHVKHGGGSVTSVYEMDVEYIGMDRERIYPKLIKPSLGGLLTFQPAFTAQYLVALATAVSWILTVILGLLCAYRMVYIHRAIATALPAMRL